MSKINHGEHAINKTVSKCNEGVDRPKLQGIDGLLCEVVHRAGCSFAGYKLQEKFTSEEKESTAMEGIQKFLKSLITF